MLTQQKGNSCGGIRNGKARATSLRELVASAAREAHVPAAMSGSQVKPERATFLHPSLLVPDKTGVQINIILALRTEPLCVNTATPALPSHCTAQGNVQLRGCKTQA